MQSGTPRDARIFDKMDIINIITNTHSCSIKAVDTRYGNTIYSTGIPLREIPIGYGPRPPVKRPALLLSRPHLVILSRAPITGAVTSWQWQTGRDDVTSAGSVNASVISASNADSMRRIAPRFRTLSGRRRSYHFRRSRHSCIIPTVSERWLAPCTQIRRRWFMWIALMAG